MLAVSAPPGIVLVAAWVILLAWALGHARRGTWVDWIGFGAIVLLAVSASCATIALN